MKQNEIIEKLEKRYELSREMNRINNLVVPPYVKKPIACKADEWNKYLSDKKEYDDAVHQKGEHKDEVQKNLEDCKSEIIKMLPSSNMWFVTDNEKYAVGHRTNDWPGSKGDLLIIEKPTISDLKEIHHQIVN